MSNGDNDEEYDIPPCLLVAYDKNDRRQSVALSREQVIALAKLSAKIANDTNRREFYESLGKKTFKAILYGIGALLLYGFGFHKLAELLLDNAK